jgi:hypothetical protein
MTAVKPIPGFQGSRTSGAKVTLYSHADDPVLGEAQKSRIEVVGHGNIPEEAPSVVSIQTSKSLGAASGTWSAEVKAPAHSGQADLLERVVDDDWVDLSLTVNARKTHIMRGQVDTMRRRTAVGGNGATTRVYSFNGRDHGAIFEKSNIWFNQFTSVNAIAGQLGIRLGQRIPVGPPNAIVEQLLYGMLDVLHDAGNANWRLPRSMGVLGGAALVDAMPFLDGDFDNDPPREANLVTMDTPNGRPLWSFAQEWADPMFCELFCDLTPAAGGPIYMDPNKEYGEDDTMMAVFFRNKPFPTTANPGGPLLSSLWGNIPMVEIPEQYISNMDVGRGGTERFTMFTVSPQVVQAVSDVDYTAPLWSPEDVGRHGVRQFAVESRYVTKQANLLTMTKAQREQVVSWHAIAPYLLNGNITLGALFPGIRVGMRLRIVNERSTLQESYYVEGVSHRWNARTGGSTSLVVTRGWRGTDEAYMNAVYKLSDRYEVAK